jgi:hypothetical protein
VPPVLEEHLLPTLYYPLTRANDPKCFPSADWCGVEDIGLCRHWLHMRRRREWAVVREINEGHEREIIGVGFCWPEAVVEASGVHWENSSE